MTAIHAQVLAPPQTRPSMREWLQHNLFDGIWNTLLTVAIAALLVLVMARAGPWIARAHWGVVVDHPRFWLIGLMPVELAVRAYWAGGLIGVMVLFTLLGFSVFVPLVSGDALSRVERAMVAMIVFTSAYVGEIVRAGIQAVPRGQVEAARAVGLSGLATMRHVVLPQAVKNMIPALVGQFISLFKDTSLTVIIGLTELVGTGRALLAITQYLHDVREVYVFLLLTYFAFSYAMSSASRKLERWLGLGER